MKTKKEDSKLSNPKDIVGVRKAPMSTVSAPVVMEVGVAMLEGACKYGRHNYREVGVRASVYYDATMRHLMDWWEGKDIDPDSGMNHVTKAIASLFVLRDSMISRNWEDDRPPSMEDFLTDLNARAAAIIDRYADRNPIHYTQVMKNKVAPPPPPPPAVAPPPPVAPAEALQPITWAFGDPDRRHGERRHSEPISFAGDNRFDKRRVGERRAGRPAVEEHF